MFAFQLGHNKELSLMELKSLIGKGEEMIIGDLAFFDISSQKSVEIMNKVGGSSKLIEFIYDGIALSKDDFILFAQEWMDRNIEGKISFGLTYVNDIPWPKAFNVGLELKKGIKGMGRSCRVVTSKNNQLSAADILKNKILGKDGVEFVVARDDKRILVGVTRDVQDIDAWAFRDMKRPGRNAKRGMLPPKLARIMLNLAHIREDEVVLDAFCGSGTVLMEAGLLGIRKMIASDISSQAVADTKDTIKWIKNQYNLDFEVDYFVSKAENLPAVIAGDGVDVVVSEVFLGKPKTGRENMEDIMAEKYELEHLYEKSLAVLGKILSDGGRIVLAMPVVYMSGREISLDFEKTLVNLKLEYKIRYHREGQFVGRDVVFLKKS